MYLSKNRKSGIWYIYYRQHNGKKTRISTKTKFKSEALIFLNKFENKIKATQSSPPITLKEFSLVYLDTISVTHTKQSYRLSSNSLDKFIEYAGADTLLKDITKDQAHSFILNTYQRAKHQAALQMRHLKAGFNFAILRGLVQQNPFNGIKLRIPERPHVFITKEELNKITKVETNSILSSIYKFCFFTGCRIGEVINLQFSHCDMNARQLNIQNTATFRTKTGTNRTIPMSESVVRIISEMRKQQINEYTFGKRYSSTYISHRFKKAIRQLEMNESLRLHDLRHSFASHLVLKGVSIYVVQRLLGHSQISTTQRYLHLNNESLKQAINLFD